MIIYDVISFPKGMDINTWYALFEKGLVIYDSMYGNEPFILEDNGLSLIDITEISSDDALKLTEAINGLNDDFSDRQKTEIDMVRKNNQKLIDYLKNINK